MKLLLPVFWLIGCSGIDSGGPQVVTTDTLPNGAVRVANSGKGLWNDTDAWELTPELVLGELEGPGAAVFGSIRAIQADDDGRIYVVDGQANELRIFSPNGSHVRTVGRSGGGPGEYSGANGLLWLTPDTLLVVDQSGGRYSILTRTGEYVRSVPRRLGFWGYAFDGGYEAGRVYEQMQIGTYPDLQPILLSLDVRPGGESVTDASTSETASPESVPDTVMLPLPAQGLLPELFIFTNSQGEAVASMPIPFSPRAVYHLDGRGSIWHGHGSEFRIFQSTFAGDTIMEVTLDATPAPVREEDREEWLASEIAALWRSRAWPYDTDRIPEVKPYFDGIFVDPEGYLWVSAPAEAGVTYEVFDPAGRHLGRVHAGGFERLPWVPLLVRGGRVYLAGRDDLDVERVYVFRIER